MKHALLHSLQTSACSLVNLFFGQYFPKSSSSSFEGYPLQVRHKQYWGREFILLLSQAVVLPGSDAGSDVFKPTSIGFSHPKPSDLVLHVVPNV